MDHLGGRRLLLGPAVPARAPALRGGCGASDPDHLGGAGEVDPGGGLDGLDGAPHPPAVTGVDARDGRDVLPGQFLQGPFQARLVVLDRQEVVGAAGDDPLGGAPPGVHGVGGDQGPVQVQGGEQVPQGGDLVGLIRHSALPHDHSARPARGRQEVGAGLSPVRAPRMVSSSTAITLRPAMVPVWVKNQEVRRASRPAGSRSFRTRLIVDSLGRARPVSRPRASRSAGSRSAACSHIAVRLRHPASIPVTARDRIAVRQWRTPRRSLGSVTPSRTFFRGRRDRAVVVDDGMAARPPGGEVDSSTAHRPGGAAPHPRQHADNPGHQTTPHRLCRDPGPVPSQPLAQRAAHDAQVLGDPAHRHPRCRPLFRIQR